MNIADFSIQNKVISWMIILLLVIGGTLSFLQLGMLEFPEFTIKTAMVVTPYPGASPEQVEEEVTLPLEESIQQLAAVKHVMSTNTVGLSQITVEIKDKYSSKKLPQVWDELRRKVSDTQKNMPPGIITSIVIDDYGDVFGILMNVTGPDFSYRELENYTKFLKRELTLIPGVKKVSLAGLRQEQVVIEISQAKIAALNINPDHLFALIQNHNVVSNAGSIFVDGYSIRIHPTGEFDSVLEMENMLISPPGSTNLIYLHDIANVNRVFDERPQEIYRANGHIAISVGIAFNPGVNVVDVGQRINNKLMALDSERPVGIEVNKIYNQSLAVSDAVNSFLINLLESIIIVIIALLIAMGVRSGLLMGAVLLLTMLGTFIVMSILDIQLQIISLGALIIALGMLVDNAIVITEGVMVGLERGQTKLQAATTIVQQTQWPLFGATAIAIIAFAPIGLSLDSTGEFCYSLFQVIFISLLLSWFTAVSITPFFCSLFFKQNNTATPDALSDLHEQNFVKINDSVNTYTEAQDNTEHSLNLYNNRFYTLYLKSLAFCVHHKVVTMITVLSALLLSIYGFTYVKNVFFPPSNTPIFFVDIRLSEGSDIRTTQKTMISLEKTIMPMEGVATITTVIGRGAQRFVLPYQPEKSFPSYGQLIIRTDTLTDINRLIPEVSNLLASQFNAVEYQIKRMENGPSPAAKVEARFYGEDINVLRSLAQKAIKIYTKYNGKNIRHSWRNQTMIIRPNLDMIQARKSSISKQQIDDALLVNFSGKQVGIYRDNSHLLPIIIRAPEQERLDADSITSLQIWSNEYSTFIPVTQLVSNFTTQWENPIIMRRDRKRMLAVLADPDIQTQETADELHSRVRGDIETIKLPAGYSLEWGGEYESSSRAKSNIFKSLPLGYLVMVIITVCLFNSIRKTLTIWITVPLAITGVTAGLLLLNAPFSFMALLGLLSLSGMLVKNGIVLVDQINFELTNNKSPGEAIRDAAVSRVRPVCMAAITTMLGMIPLIFDPFFQSMAVTIIFGLGFATILTLIVLPVTYALLFRIKELT